VRLLNEVIGRFKAALEVYTEEHFPEQHQQTQNNLSLSRRRLAEAEATSGGSGRRWPPTRYPLLTAFPARHFPATARGAP
jgi:hypothetical protein